MVWCGGRKGSAKQQRGMGKRQTNEVERACNFVVRVTFGLLVKRSPLDIGKPHVARIHFWGIGLGIPTAVRDPTVPASTPKGSAAWNINSKLWYSNVSGA